MDKLIPFLWVGIGGSIGCITRYSISLSLQNFSIAFPYGTLIDNLIACFVIGVVSELGIRTGILSVEMRLALITGFCGGLSTLSSFMYEFGQLIRSAEYLRALTYLNVTLILSFLCYEVGISIPGLIYK